MLRWLALLGLTLALSSMPAQAGDPPGARAAAADRLQQAEATAGPDSPQVIVPAIDLAAALLAEGNADGAASLLARASGLLDRYPEQDRALRLRVLILQSDLLVRLGRLADSNKVLYEALDLSRRATSISPLEQANVLERLAANEGRRGRATSASSYVSDALALRGKHFGKDSPEYAAALLRAADWYRYNGNFRLEVDAEKTALAILEATFGARDPRLAIPLIRLATTRIAQRAQRGDAVAAMDRASALEFGPGPEDAYIRAEILATQADLHVVFGKPGDGTPVYAQAWRRIATHEQLGDAAANQYFARVRQLFVSAPDVIANIGTINLAYTVTATGTVDDVRIVKNAVPATDGSSQAARSDAGSAMWMAMRRSRYRPRVVDGVPVATPDLRFSSEFCLDPTQFLPICTGGANASAVR
ncbi:MAG: tetratricopeptide repeat protein [Chromatiales bacterium]|nr:tetratricopeptide repeat protein [Chromatiales bacterium]